MYGVSPASAILARHIVSCDTEWLLYSIHSAATNDDMACTDVDSRRRYERCADPDNFGPLIISSSSETCTSLVFYAESRQKPTRVT